MAEFLTDLDARLKDDDTIWVLDSPLVYQSDILGRVTAPAGFETDFASVPRLPIIYAAWGDRAHREAVIHDYLYRIDSIPPATFDQANNVFLEAMNARNKPWYISLFMYWGVSMRGCVNYHRKRVGDKL